MKYLLIGGICWGTDPVTRWCLAEVFNMVQHRRLLNTVDNFAVLSTSDTADIGRHSSIDNNVIRDGISLWKKTP